MHQSAGMQISVVSVQVSSRPCSACFGTMSHLVPAVRQSGHDAPRLSIVHAWRSAVDQQALQTHWLATPL